VGDVSLPPSVQWREGPNGVPVLHVETDGHVADIAANGAHLLNWIPRGQQPILWMSRSSRFAAGVPIRGGVPVCFPWFGQLPGHPEAPMHGFARLCEWQLLRVTEGSSGVELVFRLTEAGEHFARFWPHRFEALYTVAIGAELGMTLEVVNHDDSPFAFEAVLHSYYAVADARPATVRGLEGLEFRPKGSTSTQRDDVPVAIGSGISRRYPDTADATIVDPGNRRTMTIKPAGARSAILWNPGAEIAQSMEDFDDEGWKSMVCYESGNVGDTAILLAAGERNAMSVTVSVSTDRPSA